MSDRTDSEATDLPFESLDEAAGPARLMAPAEADRLISAAMARASVKRSSGRVISLHPRRRRKVVALAGAAVLCGATVAAAHRQGWIQPLLSVWTAPAPSPAPAKGIQPPPAPRQPAAPPESLPEPSPEPEPTPTTSPNEPSRSQGTASSRPRPVKPPRRASKTEQARDLLREANALRSRQHYQAAAEKYSQLARSTPNSPEAQPARVSAATLLLEHLHQAERAEELFAEAERRGGELAPEAAFGVAEARRAQGDHTGEAEQLRKLVQQYPNSTLATLARQRLARLSVSP